MQRQNFVENIDIYFDEDDELIWTQDNDIELVISKTIMDDSESDTDDIPYLPNIASTLAQQQINPSLDRFRRKICQDLFERKNFVAYDKQIAGNFEPYSQMDFKDDFILCVSNKTHKIFQVHPGKYDDNEKLYIEDMSTKEYEVTTHFIRRCQWFPLDIGLYAWLEEKIINLVDTSTQNIIFKFPFLKNMYNFSHMDWSSLGQTPIALAANNAQVIIFEPKSTSSLNITVKDPADTHKPVANVVYWSPTDESGLFVGTKCGSILFYDTRFTKRPLCSYLAPFLFSHEIIHLSMTPDLSQLVTLHPTSYQVLHRWKILSKRENFLKYIPSNNNEPSCRVRRFRSYNYQTHVQPLIANEYALLPGKFSKEGFFKFLPYKTPISSIPVLINSVSNNRISCQNEYNNLIYGYGRTVWGDEPLPALFYFLNDQLMVRRMKFCNNLSRELDQWSHDNDDSDADYYDIEYNIGIPGGDEE